jgi:hypothetical protein
MSRHMAHTNITISNEEGSLVASAPSVSVVHGDTIVFSTNDGSSVVLFFSPGAVSVLSPVPSGPITVAGAETAKFTFTSSEAGAYSVIFRTSHAPVPTQFPVRESNELLLHIGAGHGSFGGGGPIVGTNTAGFAATEPHTFGAHFGGPIVGSSTAGVSGPHGEEEK